MAGDVPLGALVEAGSRWRFIDAAATVGESYRRLPLVLRLLLENALRHAAPGDTASIAVAFRAWLATGSSTSEIAFLPNRLMMHDTTCGPALVDIAAMRDTLHENGLSPDLLRPRIPVDVSTDHSSGVDVFGRKDALAFNLQKEFARNGERYRLMKWASAVMPSIRVHPPGSGIMHTINLERLSRLTIVTERDGEPFLHPDMMLGTDSHTPMINGLGVLAWGIGGLEAEGALFGVPTMLRIPEVVGVRLTGRLPEGATATDLALVVTSRLRHLGVAGSFVEFFGTGVSSLSVGERAAVANMAPEYGATTGYFPIDDASIAYLRSLGRDDRELALVTAHARAAGIWFDPDAEPRFSQTVAIDLSEVRPSVAGPRRPQDIMDAGETHKALGLALLPAPGDATLPDGAVAIAAITSCTNTSDPRLLITAGLLAQKASALGLKPPRWVKTSLAPGSPAAGRFLARAGLLEPLERLGFSIVGYGCTTCIGNSGALTAEMAKAVAGGVRAVAVLSGNRNFPGRVHPDLDLGFLASPPLVVAFALAGKVGIDITKDPLGQDSEGRPVRLSDIWPTGDEIDAAMTKAMDAADFDQAYAEAAANPLWRDLDAPNGSHFPWDEASTYLRRPPFVTAKAPVPLDRPARPLLVLGDDVTTDHISPANQIRPESEAGRWLVSHGAPPGDLNVFASRRGNFEAMVRGAFTNRLATNQLVPGAPAGMTRHGPTGEIVPIPEASLRYSADGVPLVIVAGERYGMGSSRDWAAKAVALLGVRAVIAKSIERIHRTNLIGMGILPLLLPDDIMVESLTIQADDQFCFGPELSNLSPRGAVSLTIERADGGKMSIRLVAAIETSLEIELMRAGGMIPKVLRDVITKGSASLEAAE